MSMEFAALPLHMAVFERLGGDAAIRDKVKGIYDKVPEDAKYPYIVISEQTTRPFDTKTRKGENMTLVLDCYSQYDNKKEAYEILNLMLKSLSKAPLSLEGGFTMQDFNREAGTTVITDIDGSTYHGILRTRFYITN